VRRLILATSVLAAVLAARAALSAAEPPDLTKEPTLYVVGYAHLDTQWRWEYPRTIGEFLPRTMHDNFALFEKYPHYIFNFSGANRYRMMKEYYPADYAKLKEYVAAGRWFPAGSAMEESDVNSLSAESIVRQILYGTHFFRREFGHTSAEYMLPDCFGFPASLPSILAHMGIRGFSTQKLTWHSAAAVGGEQSPEKTPAGIPFNVGVWEGPDGRGVISALNPGSYGGDIWYDLSQSEPPPNARNFIDWPARVQRNGDVSGVYADYHYYGTGDVGGAPRESSVKMLESIVTGNDAPLHVISATAEQMFMDIKDEHLPRYRGDLELIEHSAGSLTSQAAHKRWNRKNELLADAAEKASVAAAWLGARDYPQMRLRDAWTLVLGGQFHDNQAGTSTPRAYDFIWNDDVLAMNQFAGVLTSATEAMASAMNTQTEGIPVVVYNPLSIAREDVVEATLPGLSKVIRVIGPKGEELPAQVSGNTVLFIARVPATGYAVFDVRPATARQKSALTVSKSGLENARYRIHIDEHGDIDSVVDKKVGKEILAAPMRLALQTERPHDWPAWNMDWADQQKPPRAYAGGPAQITVVEDGPARVGVKIARDAEGSHFEQTVRLAAGDAGNRIEIDNTIDWKTSAAALKATFPLAAANPKATYNWDVGTIERGNNEPTKYEVASHQWMDLTDAGGAFGVTVLSDCKFGSDKPDDHTLRLTLLYTPGLGEGNGHAYSDQATQDWGRHRFVYGLASHSGDWRKELTDWQALRLNQPLIASQATKHTGALGKQFSLLSVSEPCARVMALKKAEESDDVVVRIVEVDGQSAPAVRLHFAAPVASARELNGQEIAIGKATIAGGDLVTTLGAYQIRTFAVRLAPPRATRAKPAWRVVALPAERLVATSDGTKSAPGFDDSGRSLPAEMLPGDLSYAGVHFTIGKSALVPRGQTIALPPGRRLYILAASAEGEQTVTLGGHSMILQPWAGFIGQWNRRTWTRKEEEILPRADAPPGAPPRRRGSMEYSGLEPAFIKRDPVAWFASHRHSADGANEPYAYSYLFAYSMQLPPGTHSVTLPDNDRVRIMAMTVSDEGTPVTPAQPLYDTLP
jgi:alpha-mannosidase